jgi:hypothetical protein
MATEHKLDLIALLAYVDPAYLSYQEGVIQHGK